MPIRRSIAAAALFMASSCTLAQATQATVAYNEAVRVVGGKRQVQLPPRNPHAPREVVPKVGEGGPIGFAKYMVESERGLLQCTVPYVTKEGCEPSNYGKAKRPRTWVVLRQGEWQGCTGIDTPKRCRALYPKPGSPDHKIGGVLPREEA